MKYNRGFIAGAFDAVHPGYIAMFKDCKKHCEHLCVALHVDPSIENGKLTPVMSVEERKDILLSLRFVDEVVCYNTEKELYELIKTKADVRFLGDDYIGKKYTGWDLPTPIVFLSRDHGWSTTKYKKLIYEQFKLRI